MQILRWMVCFIAALDSHSLKMPSFVSAVKGHGGGDQDGQGTRAFGCKALNVNREQVLVEIEAPLSDLRKDCCETCKFEVARYMRTNKHLLAAVAEQVGTAYADGEGEATQPSIAKSAFTCTTKGLLLALTWFSVARKKQVDKDKASKTTSSFLCSVLPADDFDISEVVGALLAEFACQCEAQPVANGECTHVQQLRHSMRTEWPVPEPARTAHALCCLLAPREDCQTLKDVCVPGFDMLAGVIDLAILEGKFEVDARTLRPKPQKRNRIDEPWKLAVINDSIKFKRAKSGRAYLRADGTGDPAIASKWEAQHM